MRKPLSILLVSLMNIWALFAQSIQKVHVIEYKGEGAKTPLANVQILVGNANKAVTNANGDCTLSFTTLKPGDKVVVRSITKAGFEVLNPNMLNKWIISANEDDPFVIVMINSNQLKEERNKYVRAAQKQISKAMMQEQLALGQKFNDNQISREEYDRLIKILREEYNKKLDDIDTYIERMVHTDVNEIASQEKDILNRVKEGDLTGAIEEYNKIDIIDVYKQQLQENNDSAETIAEADKPAETPVKPAEPTVKRDEKAILFESVKRQNDLLRIKGGQENIDKGLKLLRDFAYADTTYYSPLLEYAHYCEQSNLLDDALDALKYCYDAPDERVRISARLLRAQVQKKQNLFEEFIPSLQADYLYMDSVMLSKNDNTVFLAERAYALSVLSKSYSFLKDAENGRSIRQKMVDLNRALYELDTTNQDNKRKYVDALYSAHNSLYVFDYRVTGSDKKDDVTILENSTYLDEAIRLQQELYDVAPAKQSAMLAFLLCEKATIKRHIASAHNDTTMFNSIEEEYKYAIDMYKVAYEHNPRAYAHFLATAYFNYAGFYTDNNKFDDKEWLLGLFLKSQEFESEHLSYNPKDNRRTFAFIIWGIGVTYLEMKDYGMAEYYLVMAIDEIEPLYMSRKKTYSSILFDAYDRLIELYSPDAMDDTERLEGVKKRKEEMRR